MCAPDAEAKLESLSYTMGRGGKERDGLYQRHARSSKDTRNRRAEGPRPGIHSMLLSSRVDTRTQYTRAKPRISHVQRRQTTETNLRRKTQRKYENRKWNSYEQKPAVDKYSIAEYRRHGQESRTNIRRLENSLALRRVTLDGERIHPHPGMPVSRPVNRIMETRATAAELSVGEKWKTEGDGNDRKISHQNSGRPDLRFTVKAVIFPGGREGDGLFAARKFEKGEYLTVWMGTAAAQAGGSVAQLNDGKYEAGDTAGASHINDTRGRSYHPNLKINAALMGTGAIRAIREIPEGHEICINYGQQY
jgi:hypothetical protein